MNNLMSFELGVVTSQTPFPVKVHALDKTDLLCNNVIKISTNLRPKH